jgi:hypothetical protein
MLPAGGTSVIVDLEEDSDGTFHDNAFDGHDGFDRNTLADLLVAAGSEVPEFSHAFRIDKDGRDYDLFLAVTKRSPG